MSLNGEPSDVCLFDVVRRRAAGGDAHAEKVTDVLRKDPRYFLGFVLARVAATVHPGWEKTYRYRIERHDETWDRAYCRKIGDGPDDITALIDWFRKTYPDAAAEVEANAVGLQLAEHIVETVGKQARQAQADAETGRAECITIIAGELMYWAAVLPLDGALAEVIAKVPDATVCEVRRALIKMRKWGADQVRELLARSRDASPAMDPAATAAGGFSMWIDSMLGKEPPGTLFVDAICRLAQAGDPSAQRLDEACRDRLERTDEHEERTETRPLNGFGDIGDIPF